MHFHTVQPLNAAIIKHLFYGSLSVDIMNTQVVSRFNGMYAYLDRRALIMLLLGISAGVPIMLIFSTLGLWLQEAGVNKGSVTMFSWAGLAYSFKFIWSPLTDSLPIPLLSKLLGKRRSWLFLAQVSIIGALFLMASVNPTTPNSLTMMALGAIWLGFSSATQDLMIDAYRIEAAPEDTAMQSVMSSTYVAGYRLGMIVSGAGALFAASWFGSTKDAYSYEAWRNTYWIMATVIGVGIATTLCIAEPKVNITDKKPHFSSQDHLRLVLMFAASVTAFVFSFTYIGKILSQTSSPLMSFLLESIRFSLSGIIAIAIGWLSVMIGLVRHEAAHQSFVAPVADFFKRYDQALLILALIGLYRISDIVAGVITNLFYVDLGFDKTQIAWTVKTFGMIATITGGFAGGILAQRFPIMRMMMLGAILAAATNLLFVLLSWRGQDLELMYFVVAFDNFAAGLASTVFVAFLSALTNIRFSAVQYALFSSLMTLMPKVLGGYSGTIVEKIGYDGFFTFTALLGIPILLLVWLVDKKIFSQK